MRQLAVGLLLVLVAQLFAQETALPPLEKKAQKSYDQGMEYLQKQDQHLALWYFRDADKQDRGQCLPCHEQMLKIGLASSDWKAVEDGASALVGEVKEPKQQAVAHYYLGMALEHEGIDGHQADLLSRAHDEFLKGSSLFPLPSIVFEDGKTLAQLHKDDDAKVEFQKFISMSPEGSFERHRAQQFVSKPGLARANMVPDFAIRSSDGQPISTRALEGKVVLVHFWATTCDTCGRALPHLRAIVKKFQNQPFVLLSVSVDYNEAAWRSFLDKNDVPGEQYRDGFNGPVAQVFGVGVHFQSHVDQPIGGGGSVAGVWSTSYGMKQDVPKTFTIDADGVLQPEKLSDSLDATLQQLIDRTDQNQAKQ